MTNKRCFLVTAYCNNPTKKKALNDTLKNLKKYDTDIILFSHYPIEEDTYHLTDYSIYDYSNPVFNNHILPGGGSRSMVNWSKFIKNGIPFKINTHAVDYGYAAAQQIKRGILFAYENGYEEVFVLNYDLEVYDKMVDDFDKLMLEYDSILPIYGSDKGLYMAWFALKIKPYLNNIKDISKEDYVKSIGEGIVEEYLYSKLNGKNSKPIPRIEWEGPDPFNSKIRTTIVMEGNIMDRFSEEDFNWFIGHELLYIKNKRKDTNKQLLMLWGMNKDLDVEIFIKNKLINKSFIPKESEYHIIYLPINHQQFSKRPEDVKVVIDGWEIPKDLLILNRISSIEIAHND